VEAAIAERLRVRRTAVREALLMLERQELIVSRPSLMQIDVAFHRPLYVRLPEGQGPPPELTQILATMTPDYSALLPDGALGAAGALSDEKG
jgi:hypothetical protein